jgi:hypothetical protein
LPSQLFISSLGRCAKPPQTQTGTLTKPERMEAMHEIFLPISAIEAMLNDPIMKELLGDYAWPRRILSEVSIDVSRTSELDWVVAGLNCKNDADILPVCIHTFLMDWKPEVKK